MNKQFKDLAEGEKFVYDNLMWIKIVKKKAKTCCGGKDNAQVAGNITKTRNFKPTTEVTVIDG